MFETRPKDFSFFAPSALIGQPGRGRMYVVRGATPQESSTREWGVPPTLETKSAQTPPQGPHLPFPGDHQNDPRGFQFDLPPQGSEAKRGKAKGPIQRLSPDNFGIEERWFPGAGMGKASHWRGCTSPRHNPETSPKMNPENNPRLAVECVVIHATAGRSSDGAYSVMRAGRASFHWLVPHPSEIAHGSHVWATAPESVAAWHVANRCRHPDVCGGRQRINHASLGIEIVNAQDGRDAFSPWQVEATAALVRYARAKYPNLRHVVSHAKLDPERRSDPGPNFPWEEFARKVSGRFC